MHNVLSLQGLTSNQPEGSEFNSLISYKCGNKPD